MRRIKRITGIILSLMLSAGILTPACCPGGQKTVFAAAAGAAETAGQSEDNSLSSLSISPGTLSPAFQYNNVNYTASVGEDVTSVEVNAQTSNPNATVESVTGNKELKPGENLISIVVKAENGTAATYKITVTRGGTQAPVEGESAPSADAPQTPEVQGSPEGITINGHPFNLAASVPQEAVPQDFAKTQVSCQGQQVEGLHSDKSGITLVYLTTPSTEVKNTLAVYEEETGRIYQFRKIQLTEADYLILLDPPAEGGPSAEYAQTAQSVGGYENVPAFARGAGAQQGEEGQETKGAEFLLVYAASSFGNKGWYQYDAKEATFQRYVQAAASSSQDAGAEGEEEEPSVEMQGLQNAYKDLEERYNKNKEDSRKVNAVLIFIIAVLVVAVANLLLRGKKEEDDLDEEESYQEPRLRKRKHMQESKEAVQEEARVQRKHTSKPAQDKERQDSKKLDEEEDWAESGREDKLAPKRGGRQDTRLMPDLDEEPQNKKLQPSQSRQAQEKQTSQSKQPSGRNEQGMKGTQIPPSRQSLGRNEQGMKGTQMSQSKQSLGRNELAMKGMQTSQAKQPQGRKEQAVKGRQRLPVSPVRNSGLEDDFEVIDLEDL